jgi:cytosine/adenosine deaminase-related metal-dependent hydrolase
MGVRIVAGTDAGYTPTSPGLGDEVAELVQSGMPAMAAIRAVTSVSAECLGVEKRTGTIKPGMVADFNAVDGDPVANIAACRADATGVSRCNQPLAECAICTRTEDCQAAPVCGSFSDGSRRCGSGVGATTCRAQ